LLACLTASVHSLLICSGDAPKCIYGTPDATESTPVNFKVAFFGDQGLGDESKAVLQLVKSEGADAVIHSGDFDYTSDPQAWEDQINSVLGADYPYFASIGNHDVDAWTGANGYQQKIYDRLHRLNITTCNGEVGVNTVCSYKGIMFVLSGVGTRGDRHARFVEESFGQYGGIWRVCSWHKNMKKMQTGNKEDATGWDVYDTCKRMGAFIATGHEHEYSRTKLLSSFEHQTVESEELVVSEGKSFAFVSGVAGVGVRAAARSLTDTYWATALDMSHDLKSGSLFCTFNVSGENDTAHCYFKQIDGTIRDEFNVSSLNSMEGPGVPLDLRRYPGKDLRLFLIAVCVACGILALLAVFTLVAWTRHQKRELKAARAYSEWKSPDAAGSA